MKRTDFMKIIKLRSVWKVDRRKGNYKLPNGKVKRKKENVCLFALRDSVYS